MKIYVVIDTNVLVSSLLTSDKESPTLFLINAIDERTIIPIYSKYLLSEYREVLARSKFSIDERTRTGIMELFIRNGFNYEPSCIDVKLPDSDDEPIFMITMQTRDLDTFLITGNIKHYPAADFVVTPREMVTIIRNHKTDTGNCLQ